MIALGIASAFALVIATLLCVPESPEVPGADWTLRPRR
jgi:hypothetical protein